MNVRIAISVALFCLTALLSFSVWAFGSRWFSSEPMMYAGCAVVFLVLGGISLLPVSGHRGKKAVLFGFAFASAFLLYALIWSVAWFSMPNTYGEIFGSLIGLAALAAVFKLWLKLPGSLLLMTACLFLYHTAGYYLGGMAYDSLQNRGRLAIDLPWDPAAIRLTARLAWGFFYGLGLGLGLSTLLYLSRQSSASPSTQI